MTASKNHRENGVARRPPTPFSTGNGRPARVRLARCFLVACEVDGGVVITLMRCRTSATLPLFGPSDVLHMPAGMAGFRRWEPAVGDYQLRAVPAGLVGQVAPRCA